MTPITPHFNYEPFWNGSETAKKHHIDNSPTPAARENIYKIVRTILEPIAVKYGKPIRVNSSYRCPQVNELVHGSKTSQHMTGAAVDIAANGGGGTNSQLFKVIVDMIKSGEIKVGQLIWEFGSLTNPQWVHVSLPYSKTNQIIRAIKVGDSTKYIPFIEYRKLQGGAVAPDNKKYAPATSETPNQTNPTENSVQQSRESNITITTTKTAMTGRRVVKGEYKKQ